MNAEQRVEALGISEYKTCSMCGLRKPIYLFRWKNKLQGVRIALCPECDKAYRAKRYETHRNRIQEITRKSQERRRERIAKQGVVEEGSRRCIDCLQIKEATAFRWKNKALGLRVCRCNSCDSNWRADLYDNGKVPFLENNKRNYYKLRALLDSNKEAPCVDCGKLYPPYVMDFDHRDPRTKVDKVSSMVYRGSKMLLLAEIAKCDLVCANCHRIRTYKKTENRNE